MLIDKVASVNLFCLNNCFDPTNFDQHDVPFADGFPLEPKAAAKQTHGAVVRRNSGLVLQSNGGDEMVFISSALTDLSFYNGNYIYDKSAGQGQTVYVVDSGASLNNPVRIDIRSITVSLNGSTGIHKRFKYCLPGTLGIRRDRHRPYSK
jgi:hypothetical protein